MALALWLSVGCGLVAGREGTPREEPLDVKLANLQNDVGERFLRELSADPELLAEFARILAAPVGEYIEPSDDLRHFIEEMNQMAEGAKERAGIVEAEERWECGDFVYGCESACPIALTANYYLDREGAVKFDGTGTVEFAGTVSNAQYEVKGLERRWHWCPDGGRFECTIVVTADGVGKYYDFTAATPDVDGHRRVASSKSYRCMARER